MKQLSILIKPSSSLCNLRCKYCFYADLAGIRENASFGFMTDETVERMLENIRRDLSPGDRVTFAFQGRGAHLIGSPLLPALHGAGCPVGPGHPGILFHPDQCHPAE